MNPDDGSGDALDAMIAAMRAEGLSTGTPEADVDRVIGCYEDAFRPLGQSDRDGVAESQGSPSLAEQERLEALYPGLRDALQACEAMGGG